MRWDALRSAFRRSRVRGRGIWRDDLILVEVVHGAQVVLVLDSGFIGWHFGLLVSTFLLPRPGETVGRGRTSRNVMDELSLAIPRDCRHDHRCECHVAITATRTDLAYAAMQSCCT